MANLKEVIYLSNEDFETLSSTGTVTIDGVTLTYDENTVYVTPDILASTTEDGLMSKEDKAIIDSLADVATSGDYDDLINKPSIPDFADVKVGYDKSHAVSIVDSSDHTAYLITESAYDSSTNKVATMSDLPTVPTNVSSFTNDAGYTTNTGTVTSIKIKTGTGLSGGSNTAATTTGEWTIGIDSGYKLPTTTEWGNKADASDIPSAYIASVSTSGNTLTLVPNEGIAINYTPTFTDTNQKITAKLNGSNVSFGNDDVVELVAGSNVTITPDTSAKTITIAASGGGQTTATDVQINGTSIVSGNTANILVEGTYSSTNKIATMSEVPDDTSDLTNGAGFITSSDLPIYSLDSSDSASSGAFEYVESVSSTGASDSGKYMHFSAGTTPASGATPGHTSTTSGANSGSAVTVVTGITAGSGSLTSDTTSSGGIEYLEGATLTAASLGTADTGTVTVSGGTTTPTTKYLSASFSGTAATITPTLSAGTTKYLSAAFSGSSATSEANSGSAVAAYTSVTTAGSVSASRSTSGSGTSARRTLTISHSDPTFGTTNAAPNAHTHAVTATGSVSLTANDSTATGRITYLQAQGTITGASYTPAGSITLTENDSTDTGRITFVKSISSTAASLGGTTTFVTGYSGFDGGSLTPTTKYLHHTHTSASASGTGSAAPNEHTHSYDKTTSVSLTAGTAPSLTFDTTATGGEYYVTAVSGGTTTSTTKYLTLEEN